MSRTVCKKLMPAHTTDYSPQHGV